MLQLQLCLQLQQNTMVPVDVDGQICHFCSQGFVTRNKSVTSMESSSSLLSLSSCSFYSPSSSTLLLLLILSLSLASSSFYSSSSTSSLLSFSNPSFNSYLLLQPPSPHSQHSEKIKRNPISLPEKYLSSGKRKYKVCR